MIPMHNHCFAIVGALEARYRYRLTCLYSAVSFLSLSEDLTQVHGRPISGSHAGETRYVLIVSHARVALTRRRGLDVDQRASAGELES